jgi:hypothetical protein
LDGANTGQFLISGQGMDTYGWYLGAQHYYGGGANFYVQGNLEEFHFSNIARSGNWIATEYANQGSPSTFYALRICLKTLGGIEEGICADRFCV